MRAGDAHALLSALSQRDSLLLSPNTHELRAYNRLALMARGAYIGFLQDDSMPPPPNVELSWLVHSASLFWRFPRAGAVGIQMGLFFVSAFDESTIIAASASVAYIAASVVGTPAVAAAAEAASAPKFPASLSSPPQDGSPSPPQPQQLLRSPSPPPPPFSPATAGSPSAGSPSSAGFSSPTLSDDSFDGLQADLVRLKLASDQARARLAGHPWTAPAAPAPAAAPK